jgi:glycerol-3-phosphate cytidylyltransferase-like family protein
LFREVELPRRPLSDVEAETANRLTVMMNYQAVCRLVSEGKLVEKTIRTLAPQGTKDPAAVEYIRRRSLALGRDQKEVEAEIEAKMGKKLVFAEIQDFEQVTNDWRREK